MKLSHGVQPELIMLFLILILIKLKKGVDDVGFRSYVSRISGD